MSDLYTNTIQLRGQVDVDTINAKSPLQMTMVETNAEATVLVVHTDQSGLVGLIRYLHGQGFELLATHTESATVPAQTTGRISRRQFLRMGGVAVASAGMTLCGATVFAPDPLQIALPSYIFGGNTMDNRVLIAYASYAGSTAEIAAIMGETLNGQGFGVDVIPMQGNPQIEDYQSVILGSAVHYGKWRDEAVEFVTSNQQALSNVPVATFCVHISNTGNDSTSRQNREAYMDAVRPFLQPVSEGFFAGEFNRRGAKLMLPGFIAPFVPQLDFRDWNVIKGWVANLVPTFETACLERV